MYMYRLNLILIQGGSCVWFKKKKKLHKWPFNTMILWEIMLNIQVLYFMIWTQQNFGGHCNYSPTLIKLVFIFSVLILQSMYQVSQKKWTARFSLIWYSKILIAFFISSDKTLSSEKNDTKIIEIGWVVFYSMVISQNIVIFNFLFILVTVRDNGFSDFHILLLGSPLIRANKTKRELMDYHTRLNSSRRFKTNCKWLSFKKWL